MDRVEPRLRSGLLCALLAGVTMAAFARVFSNGFILCDDPIYVTGNDHVLAGWTWDSLIWAFTGTATPLKVVYSFGVPLSMPSALAPLSPLI